MLSFSFLKSLVNVTDVESLIPAEVLETLTANDTTVIDNAINRAVSIVLSKLRNCGVKDLNEEDLEVVKTALEKLAVYEVSTYAIVETSFEGFKNEAIDLLNNYFYCQKAKPKAAVRQDKRIKSNKTWDVI